MKLNFNLFKSFDVLFSLTSTYLKISITRLIKAINLKFNFFKKYHLMINKRSKAKFNSFKIFYLRNELKS